MFKSTRTPLTHQLFEAFDCTRKADGELSLRTDTTVDCSSRTHQALLLVLANLLGILVIGGPFYLISVGLLLSCCLKPWFPLIQLQFLATLKRKGLLLSEYALSRFGVLYETYNSRFIHMEAFIMLRKVAQVSNCCLLTPWNSSSSS